MISLRKFKGSWLLESSFLLIILGIGLQIQQSNAESIVLDLNSDASKEWIEVSCVYNRDHNDFWVFGYPVNMSPEEEEGAFPTNKGFWTPGTGKTCEIHYYGGSDLAQAKSLKFRLFLKGASPKIEVKGKKNPLGMDYNIVVGTISQSDGEGWIEPTIDMASVSDALVLSMVLTSSGDDRLLLDKITVDLGEDIPAPTTPPTTTTQSPIQDDLVVTLNTDRDYLNVWNTNCHFADDYSYFWAYGKDCAVNPGSEIPETYSRVGYWTPCAGRSCRIRYISNSTVVPTVPSSLNLKTYVEGRGSNIRVTMQEIKYADSELDCANCQLIKNEVMEEDGWKEVDTGLLKRPGLHYIVNIELISGAGGVVMLNQATMNLTQMVTTVPPPTTTTVSSATNPPVTGTGATDPTGTGTGPTTEGSASSLYGKGTLFAQIAMVCLYFFVGN